MRLFTQVSSLLFAPSIQFTHCEPAGLGACGITNNDNDFIAAASMQLFDGFLYVFV